MDCYYYCVKMVILQKVMYRFKTITIKEIGKPYRRGGRNKCRVRGGGEDGEYQETMAHRNKNVGLTWAQREK